MRRLLALSHFVCAAVFISLFLWFGASFFEILPNMSSGNVWTNVPIAIILATTQAGPFAVIGIWMAVVGRWIWLAEASSNKAVLTTHKIILAAGILAIAYGAFALAAASKSAAEGGGLMGAIGLFPLVIGGCLSALALSSILYVRSASSTQQLEG
jgi:hypothetical protein